MRSECVQASSYSLVESDSTFAEQVKPLASSFPASVADQAKSLTWKNTRQVQKRLHTGWNPSVLQHSHSEAAFAAAKVTKIDKLLQELEALFPSRIFVLISHARDIKTRPASAGEGIVLSPQIQTGCMKG